MINKRKGFDRTFSKKAIVIGVIDVLSICIAYFAALWLRFEFSFSAIEEQYLSTYIRVILPWCAVCIAVFALFKLYSSIWSFVSTDELIRILESYVVLAILAYVGFNFVL